MVVGLEATNSGRNRPAAQRCDAQRASPMISAEGPIPDHLAMGTSRAIGTDPSGGPSEVTQPPIRRPCNGTRTIDPIDTRSRSDSGTT